MASNPWSDLKKLRREVWVLCIAALANRMGTMVMPFLALYFTHLGHTASQAGLALGAFGAGSLLAAPIAGRLSDAIGPFRIMKLSLLVGGFMVMFLPIIDGLVPLLLAIFLWSMLGEAYRPASMAVLTDFTPPELRRSAFALNRLAINLGMSFGPAVAGFLVTLSFPSIFYVDGATSILAAGILFWALRGKSCISVEEIGTAVNPSFPAIRNGGFLLYLVALLPVSLVFFQHISTFPLYLVGDVGLKPSAIGLLFSVNTVLIILLEVPLNSAMAGWPHRIALPLGAAVVGTGFAAIRLATGFWSAAATVVFWTFGEMVLLPGSAAAVADMSPEERRGEYMGIFAMVFSLAMILGPWGGTLVLSRLGADWLWGGAFCLGLISAWLLSLRAIWSKNEHLAHP